MALALAAYHAARGDLQALASTLQGDWDYFLSNPRAAHSGASIALAFLPESLQDPWYQVFVHKLFHRSNKLTPDGYEEPPVESPPSWPVPEHEEDARTNEICAHIEQRCLQLGWKVDSNSNVDIIGTDDFLAQAYADWLKARIVRVDAYTGVLQSFDQPPAPLYPWIEGVVDVVAQYRQFYPSTASAPWFTLQEFVSNSPKDNIALLLNNSTLETVQRNVDVLAIPYLSYIGDISSLVDWVLEIRTPALLGSLTHIPNLRRAIITAIYANSSSDHQTIKILSSIASGIDPDENSTEVFDGKDATTLSFRPRDLLNSPITVPSDDNVKLLRELIHCARVLHPQVNLSVQQCVKLRLFGTPELQQELVSKFLSNTSSNYAHALRVFSDVRSKQMLSKVDTEYVYAALLEGALRASDFSFATDYFLNHSTPREDIVIKTFDHFFDSASNGNKTRGRMKDATACLDLLSSSSSEPVERRRSLLFAVNELSNFSLNFTAGVPVTPRDVRSYPDPVGLISRVLELNPSLYKSLDRLTDIATSLVHGTSSEDLYVDEDPVPVRIEALCVQSALVAGDFNTAFQYAMDLSTLQNSSVAWTACFQVGKYISPNWETSHPPYSILQKQLDMLSRTLVICPQDSISTVLSAWKRSELLLDDASESPTPVVRASDVAFSNNPLENASGAPRKRDQISNLLVSSLGWAIGATK